MLYNLHLLGIYGPEQPPYRTAKHWIRQHNRSWLNFLNSTVLTGQQLVMQSQLSAETTTSSSSSSSSPQLGFTPGIRLMLTHCCSHMLEAMGMAA